MQEKGFKLSAEDIYSVNKACMKDAIFIIDKFAGAGYLLKEMNMIE